MRLLAITLAVLAPLIAAMHAGARGHYCGISLDVSSEWSATTTAANHMR